MTRTALISIALAAVVALPASAQVPSPTKKGDMAATLIGVWEGPYTSEAVPPGTLKLTVSRDEKQQLKAVLEVISDQPPPAGDVRDFVVAANKVSWVQTIADMECTMNSELVAGVLKGNASCTQGGAVVVTANFLLEKKKS